MDTLKSIASLIRSVALSLSAKAWIVFLGIILGIIWGVPTSIYGVQWYAFKLAKQQVDCNNDFYFGSAYSNTVYPQQQLDATVKAWENHSECLKSVTPNKGTVEFLREQNERKNRGVHEHNLRVCIRKNAV